MLPDHYIKTLAAVVASALIAGCADEDAQQPTDPAVPPAEQTEQPPGDEPPTSPNPRIRFKGPKRLQMELARILELDEDEVCNELGEFDCFAVHNIALGGADPFGVALYSPIESSTATTPLAVERVVLSGCIERAVRDLNAPSSAVIFKDVNVTDGKLDPASDAVTAAIDALYTRTLQRHATENETAHLRGFYSDIEASDDTTAPAQDWASLSCFTVLTTLETLFY